VTDCAPDVSELSQQLEDARRFTERLCETLATEDFVVQSMPDASPVKWHLAHTTWFFETFVLAPHAPGFVPYREGWDYLHNSYYEAAGPRHPRPRRGMLTRPTVKEVFAYRAAIDEQLAAFVSSRDASPAGLAVIELGIHHEEQHQELLLTDLQHALSENPLRPGPMPSPGSTEDADRLGASRTWLRHSGGIRMVGHVGAGFCFDNERPAHRVYLEPFELSSELASSGSFAEFIADGGYERPELWLSDGWDTVRREGWCAPLYWEKRDGAWWRYTLHGMLPVDPRAPVCHVSYYEADAFARWSGARLPTEAEWEVVARDDRGSGQFVDDGWLYPRRPSPRAGLLGGAWVWTASAYTPYPGFAPLQGALGEYNGKFMVNQMVLRGGSCCSRRRHLRPGYRNFFPPGARWQATGIRLAR
jgi:ergothioneine biosynthesis protein EgtB